MWLGGTGFALILGLLIFGRKLRQRFSDSAAGLVPNVPARRITDGDATQKSQAISDVDFQFDDAGVRQLAGRSLVTFVADPIELSPQDDAIEAYPISPKSRHLLNDASKWKSKQWAIPVHRYE